MEDTRDEETRKYIKEKEETEDDVGLAAEMKKNGLNHIELNYEPKRKIAKYNQKPKSLPALVIHSAYRENDFIERLRQKWDSENRDEFKDSKTEAVLYKNPFRICLLPDMLEKPENVCQYLVNEMIHEVDWHRKQMDLYEFYQTRDLSNFAEDKLLHGFLSMLRRDVRPMLEKITGLKLDYVSASCSMYTSGDYLLVHDDLLNDRQIAFIYYLSPWEGAEKWSEDMGGCLEIINSDDSCLPQFPVHKKISPRNNQFAFFKVGSRSFHQVGEVTNFDYPRLTINGWFHGASNDDVVADSLRPSPNIEFIPALEKEVSLEAFINPVYLKPDSRLSIQKRIETNSEISLFDFMDKEIFDKALEQLLEDESLEWKNKGPANAQNYEVLNLESASKTVADLRDFFTSANMFSLLRDYTELDLSGPDAKEPKCSLEIQRWSLGNYTVLGDGALCEENTLDLIFYLNATEGVGVISYLSPEDEQPTDSDEDDSLLLTITPVDNALNIVYRCEGTTKFTKYVSRNTPLEKGPVFVFSCSYKE